MARRMSQSHITSHFSTGLLDASETTYCTSSTLACHCSQYHADRAINTMQSIKEANNGDENHAGYRKLVSIIYCPLSTNLWYRHIPALKKVLVIILATGIPKVKDCNDVNYSNADGCYAWLNFLHLAYRVGIFNTDSKFHTSGIVWIISIWIVPTPVTEPF